MEFKAISVFSNVSCSLPGPAHEKLEKKGRINLCEYSQFTTFIQIVKVDFLGGGGSYTIFVQRMCVLTMV